MTSHEPSLQQVLTKGVGGAELQGLHDPLVLLGHGFLRDEHSTQLPGISQSREGVLVHIFIVGTEPIQHLSDQCRVNGFVNFVRLHKVLARALFLRKKSGLCKRQDQDV